MALTERIAVIIDAASGGAVREFNKVTAASGKFTRETEEQHVQVGRLKVSHSQLAAGLRAGVATAAIAGAYALGRFAKAATAEAREAAKIGRLTEAVIASTGGAANVTADQVSDLATSLSNVAGVDDEVIQSGENVLLTFTKIRNEVGKGNDIFDQATTVALDMSTALGTDLQGSIIQVGKALNDPIKGITALSRVGVSFTQQQKDQIATLVESGKTLEAQKVILAELTTEFGGAAEAAADPAQRLTIAFQNFEESVGTTFLPVIEGVTEGLIEVAEAGQYLSEHPALQRLAVSILAVGTALFVANKGLKIYRAVQGAELIQVLTRAAIGHTAVATATSAEATAAGTATVAVEGLAAAEAAAGAASVGLLAKVGGAASLLARTPLMVGFGGLKEGVIDTTQPVEKLVKSVEDAGGSLHDLAGELIAAGGEIDKSTGGWVGVSADEVERLAEKYGVASDAAGDMATAEQGVAQSHEEAAQAAEEAREAEQDLLDARIASFNAAISYTRSELDVKDAIVAVSEAQKDGSHEEYRRAVLDAKDALLSEADAAVSLARDTREAEGRTLSARSAQQIYRDELKKLAGDLAPGSPLRQYLRGLIHDLDDAGRNRRSSLTVTTYVAGSDTSYAPGTARRMASGGPVMGFGHTDSVRLLATPGEFVVREDGSNLDDAARYFSSPHANRTAKSSMSGGGSTIVNYNTTLTAVPEKQLSSVPGTLREAAYVTGGSW